MACVHFAEGKPIVKNMSKNDEPDAEGVYWIGSSRSESNLTPPAVQNNPAVTSQQEMSRIERWSKSISRSFPRKRDILFLFLFGLACIALIKVFMVINENKWESQEIPIAVGTCFSYSHDAAAGIIGNPVLCTDTTAEYIVKSSLPQGQKCPLPETKYTLEEKGIEDCLVVMK